MLLNDWLSRLERLHFKSIDMGLERIQAVAHRLQLTSDTPFIFTVAGTNGKGSTVALIDLVLRGAGYQTGLYTSPHLVDFNERVCINGVQATDEQLIAAFEAVEAGRGNTSLTYFEFTTLAAIWLFKQQGLDAWILEVGLGGRLDAVNIWDADIAVVTSIDIDHQAWLGNDRATIGREKIGIGRAGHPLVMGDPVPPEPVLAQIHSLGFQLYQQGVDFSFEISQKDHQDSTESTWTFLSDKNQPLPQVKTDLPIPSIYLQNAATALQALALSPFHLSDDVKREALGRVCVTGRKQIIHQQPDIMLDVGHNPHAAAALCRYLEGRHYRQVHCVVGMLSDKDITDTLMALLPVVDTWHPANLDCDRAMDAGHLHQQLLEMGARCQQPATSAVVACNRLLKNRSDIEVSKNDLILVFGSFYTVADVIQYRHQLTIMKG